MKLKRGACTNLHFFPFKNPHKKEGQSPPKKWDSSFLSCTKVEYDKEWGGRVSQSRKKNLVICPAVPLFTKLLVRIITITYNPHR